MTTIDSDSSYRGIWNIKIWLILSFVYSLLSLLNQPAVKSPLWFLEYLLYLLMIFGLWANTRYALRKKIIISKNIAPFVYIFFVWLFGMIYELTLTVDGHGLGGLHPNTRASFILAQGDYIAFALISFVIIRYLKLSFWSAFFLAGGKSLTEGLIFTGLLTQTIVSPFFFLSPLILAYYTFVYASFIALPLLYLNEQLLWSDSSPSRRRPVLLIWLIGFLFAFGVRLFWGLIYGPFVTTLFNLPPTTP